MEIRWEIAQIQFCKQNCNLRRSDCLHTTNSTRERECDLLLQQEERQNGWPFVLADQILAIPGLWVEAADQELPEIPEFQYDKLEDGALLRRGAINYSKLLSGWKKVEGGGK